MERPIAIINDVDLDGYACERKLCGRPIGNIMPGRIKRQVGIGSKTACCARGTGRNCVPDTTRVRPTCVAIINGVGDSERGSAARRLRIASACIAAVRFTVRPIANLVWAEVEKMGSVNPPIMRRLSVGDLVSSFTANYSWSSLIVLGQKRLEYLVVRSPLPVSLRADMIL
jgi:hypothetical protein